MNMADTKPVEKNTEENPKEDKTAENKPKDEIKYTLIKNVKYGDTPYKAGDKIIIKEQDIEEFKAVQVIKIE